MCGLDDGVVLPILEHICYRSRELGCLCICQFHIFYLKYKALAEKVNSFLDRRNLRGSFIFTMFVLLVIVKLLKNFEYERKYRAGSQNVF